MIHMQKPIEFMGRSLQDIRAMPDEARQRAGFALDAIQRGHPPLDAKPMTTVGGGVMELRIWCADGTWRIIYAAQFEDAIYVLHVFQKKTRKTPQKDLEIARTHFRQIKTRHS